MLQEKMSVPAVRQTIVGISQNRPRQHARGVWTNLIPMVASLFGHSLQITCLESPATIIKEVRVIFRYPVRFG